MSPFDVSKSISSSIENEINTGKFEGKDINKYMLLQIFSAFEDTVLIADTFNKCKHINGENLYHCLHATIQPKRNRFSKWIKQSKDHPDIEEFMERNEVGREMAIEVLDLLDKISEHNIRK